MASEDRFPALPKAAASIALLAALFFVTGCAEDSEPAPTTPPSPPAPEPPPTPPPPAPVQLPTESGTIFLEVWELGGFVPIEYSLGRPPQYALTGGGDLYLEAQDFRAFPGKILPDIRRSRIGLDFVEVLAAVGSTEITAGETIHIEQPSTGPILADAPTLEVVLKQPGRTHLLRIEAYGSQAHNDSRVSRVRDLVALLGRLSAEAGASPFRGDRVQVYVIANPQPADASFATEQPWPLPDPPAPEPDGGASCVSYGGDAAAAILETLKDADHATRWIHEGAPYQLAARDLLPGEEPCAR